MTWPFAIDHATLGVPGAEQRDDNLWRLARPVDAPAQRADVWLLALRGAAWPDPTRPGAAACVPPGFDPGRPLDVVLYFHGHNGCVATAVGDGPAPCTHGGKVRNPSKLALQLGDAGVNALLLAPELKADAPTGDPGALAKPGGMKRLLDEALGALLPALGGGPASAASIRSVLVMAHSGGYVATAAACRELPVVRQVALLDAFYGETRTFRDWVEDRKGELGPGPTGARFSCVYTAGGGTADNACALAGRLQKTLPRQFVRHDDTHSTLAAADYAAQPVLFKRSALSHGDVSRYYPRHLIAAAGFDPIAG